MRSETVTTVLPAPKGEVFAYLAEIENLPALGDGVRARAEGRRTGRHKVVNGAGRVLLRDGRGPTSSSTGVIEGASLVRVRGDGAFPSRA